MPASGGWKTTIQSAEMTASDGAALGPRPWTRRLPIRGRNAPFAPAADAQAPSAISDAAMQPNLMLPTADTVTQAGINRRDLQLPPSAQTNKAPTLPAPAIYRAISTQRVPRFQK